MTGAVFTVPVVVRVWSRLPLRSTTSATPVELELREPPNSSLPSCPMEIAVSKKSVVLGYDQRSAPLWLNASRMDRGAPVCTLEKRIQMYTPPSGATLGGLILAGCAYVQAIVPSG